MAFFMRRLSHQPNRMKIRIGAKVMSRYSQVPESLLGMVTLVSAPDSMMSCERVSSAPGMAVVL